MSWQLEFGVSLVPNWEDADQLLRLTQLADAKGYDLVGIQDHPYQWRYLDTWTLISWLAPQTSRIRFFPDVANLPLRPPAVLAKAAATLDLLAGGRFELGLGAGGFWDAIEAMGGPRRSPGEALRATEEAIDVIRLIWSGERGRKYEGQFYRLAGVNTGPRPAHDMGIWIGAYRPRMLDLIGRKADGWVPSLFRGMTYERLSEGNGTIDNAAVKAGRDPRSIRRILNIGGSIEPTRGADFAGPVSFWVEELTRLAVEVRMDAFVFWPAHHEADQIEQFASEVVPAVREAAGNAR